MRTGLLSRRPTRALVVGALAALLLVAAGCGDGDDDSSDDTSADTTTSSIGQDTTAGGTVVIEDFAFGDGQPVEIEAGKIVTWQNADSVRHTVTSDEDLFSSDGLQPDDTYQHQFSLAGEFAYFCNIHPEEMEGTIVVTEPEA